VNDEDRPELFGQPTYVDPTVTALPPTQPKRNRGWWVAGVAAVAALVMVLIAAAVTGGNSAVTPAAATRIATPSVARTTPTAKPAEAYNSPAQVIAALNQAGLPCGDEAPVANPTTDALAMSDCGPNVVISRFATRSAAASAFGALDVSMKGLGVAGYGITFDTWMLNLGDNLSYGQKVADVFHASLLPIGGQSEDVLADPTQATGPTTTIDDGMWSVGADIVAGTYRTTGAGEDCYWAITKSGSNGDDIVNNHIGGGHLTVRLKKGEDFESERCGTWTKSK
jgi:hypothetical protein